MCTLTFSDGGSERCFAVVNVANGADVDVWLLAQEDLVRVPSGPSHQETCTPSLLQLCQEGGGSRDSAN